MKNMGFLRIGSVVLVMFIALYCLCRPVGAVTLFLGILVYVFYSEWIEFKKLGAIKLELWYGSDRQRVSRIVDRLEFVVEDYLQKNMKRLHIYILPTEGEHVMAYGFNRIVIPHNVLERVSDDLLLALLARAVLQIYEKNCFLKRIISVMVLPAVAAVQLVSTGILTGLWLIFWILECLHIPKGAEHLLAWFIDIVKQGFEGIAHGFLSIKQIVVAAISRRSEFRADRFAQDLGFGTALYHFLLKQQKMRPFTEKSWREILFDTQADLNRRIQKMSSV